MHPLVSRLIRAHLGGTTIDRRDRVVARQLRQITEKDLDESMSDLYRDVHQFIFNHDPGEVVGEQPSVGHADGSEADPNPAS